MRPSVWSRRAVALVALVVLTLVFGACRSSDGAAVKLDGSARVPDDEGVVAAVSRESIELEGGRTYKLSPKLMAFSTYNRHTISVLGTRGDYVHVGVDGNTVTWLSRIGVLTQEGTAKPVVIYEGELRAVDDDRLEFADGTVLRLADGLELDDKGPPGTSLVAIDPAAKRVQGITLPPKRAATTTTRAS